MQDELKRVLDEYITLVESEENARRQTFWEPEPVYCRDKFRRIARPWRETGKIPFVAYPSPSLWAKHFNFSLKQYYLDPEYYLLNYLKMMVAQFKLNDYTTLDKTIPVWPGATLEASLFGMETIYLDEEEPWLGTEVVLKEKSDLEKLTMPDFYKSGLMPLVHRLYAGANELLAGTGCKMAFPEILRSPYGLAYQLRGFGNLAIDLLDDPAWVHQLLRFLTDARKKWYEERAKFLHEDIPVGHLFNDEVDCNIIGPYIYNQIIFPYEVELAEFHGGIAYWHSCGNITPILKTIKQIPNLQCLNIGPWTDYAQAARTCPEITLEIVVKATDDVYQADQQKMEAKIRDIATNCIDNGVRAFNICTSSLQPYSDSTTQDLAKAQEWINIVREITEATLAG